MLPIFYSRKKIEVKEEVKNGLLSTKEKPMRKTYICEKTFIKQGL